MAHVLLADDNRELAENLAEILELGGHGVRTAETVAAFAEAFDPGGLDLVVSDMLLPDGTGIDVVRIASAAAPPVPVVLWTAYAGDRRVECAVAAGAVGVLRKPCDLERLLAFVERLSDPAAAPVAVCVGSAAWRSAVASAIVARTPFRPVAVGDDGRLLAPVPAQRVRAVIAPPGAAPDAPWVAGTHRIEVPEGPGAEGGVHAALADLARAIPASAPC